MLNRTVSLFTLLVMFATLLAACGGTPATEAPPAATNASTTQAPAAAPAETPAEEVTAAAPAETPAEEATAAVEPTPAPTTGKTSNYDSAAEKITFWFMPNGAQPLAFMQEEADAFAKANPDIGVDYQVVDWSNAYTQLQTALQGGSDACVTQLGTTWVPGFSATEGLRPFTAEVIQAMGGEEAFVPVSWKLTGYAGNENVYATPWFVDVRAIAYRKDIFEKAGVDPKEAFKDMDSFAAALQKVKDSNPEVAPFVHPGRNDWNVWQNTSQFIWNFGGDILGQDNKAAFNSQEAIDGIEFFTSLYGKGLTASDTLELNSAQAEGRFGNGEAAALITHSGLISQARAPKDNGGWANDEARENFAFAEFPAGPGGQYTFVGGSQLAIFNDCPNPEAAVKFVQYLTSKESQARYGANIGMLPALKEGQNDPTFSDPIYDVFKSAATKGKSAPAVVEWGAIENTFQTELQGIWEDVAATPGQPLEEAKIKTRLDAAAETVNGLLGQ